MMGRSPPALPDSPDFGVQEVVGHRGGGGNGRVRTTYGASGLRPHRGNQRRDAQDVHDAGEIVGEHVQRHLGAHAFQRLHQEVGRAHPGP
jgi:hypothetical protein